MIRRTLLICFCAITLCSLSYASSNVIFEDLTGVKFKGPESDLGALLIKDMHLLYPHQIFNPDGDLGIGWEVVDLTKRGEVLESFVLNFQIFDRVGKEVFQGKKEWKRAVSGRNRAEIPLKTLNYGKVKYWISEIDVSSVQEKKQQLALSRKKSKKEVEVASHKGLQKSDCDLKKPIYCTDYSKNIGYGELKMGKKLNPFLFAKKNKLLVKEMREKTENRYLFYLNKSTQRNSSDHFTVYATRQSIIKYITWSNSSDSLPVHVEGMKKFLKITKEIDL